MSPRFARTWANWLAGPPSGEGQLLIISGRVKYRPRDRRSSLISQGIEPCSELVFSLSHQPEAETKPSG